MNSEDRNRKVNALLMDEKDNVVTCVEEIQVGKEVVYACGNEVCTVTAQEKIPYCHKIAIENLEQGQNVVKYGELIGKTCEKIEKGHWVSHNNISSVPRDYMSEYIK